MHQQKFGAIIAKTLFINMTDLKTQVVEKLRGRSIAEWDAIAADAGVSPSMVAQLGRGHYKSSPTYDNLTRIAAAVARHPRRKAAA